MPYRMMSFTANTAGIGFSQYLKDSGGTAGSVGKVSITNATNAAVWIKVGSGTKPSTPTSAYVAGNDDYAYTVSIPAGNSLDIGADLDGKGFVPGCTEPIDWVAGWCVGNTGAVSAVGH